MRGVVLRTSLYITKLLLVNFFVQCYRKGYKEIIFLGADRTVFKGSNR